MIDYDKAQRIKEIYNQIEEFDKKWLGPKGIFNALHKVGAISDDDHKVIIEEYDRVMSPIHKAEERAKKYATDRIQRFLWNSGLVDNAGEKSLPEKNENSANKNTQLSLVDKIISLF
jgi:hypothetical protein